MTSVLSLLDVGVGIAIGVYIMYTQMKINNLEKEIDAFPTIEDLAKEIIKIKLPISDLPPDLANKIKTTLESQTPTPSTSPINFQNITRPDYMG